MQRRLERALSVAGDTHSREDIARAVADGRMQCWTRGVSMTITEVMQYPKRLVLNVVLAVGKMEDVLGLQNEMMAFGREHGATVMRMEGRKGWAKVLPTEGWKKDHKDIFERPL